MRRLTTTGSAPAVAGIAVAAVAVVYAWWVTGIAPFTTRAYIAVGVSALVLALAAVVGPASRRARLDTATSDERAPETGKAFPWVIFLLLAVVLEAIGLALGGRSSTVPTLSTVIDHAMSKHIWRFLAFCFWLVVAWGPLVRMVRRSAAKTKDVD